MTPDPLLPDSAQDRAESADCCTDVDVPPIARALRACLLRALRVATLGLVLVATAACQRAPTTWRRVVADSASGALFAAVEMAGRRAIAVGATNHVHQPPYAGDVLIMQFDLTDGDTIWRRTWGGPGYEQAWRVTLAADGGYYVFGETDSYGAGDRDFFLLEVSGDGHPEWFRTYGTPRREWPFGMLPLRNGDLLLYGRTVSGVGSEDAYAVRVDPLGDVVWEYTDRTPTDVLILDAVETPSGEIILCNSIDQDAGLTALSATGRQLWMRRYALDGWQYGSAIEAAADGYLVAGFAMAENDHADVWLARVSLNGELDWQRTFGDPGSDDYAMSLRRLADGTYLMTGLGRGLPRWKLDAAGNVMEEHRLTDSALYAAGRITVLRDGGVLIPGLRFSVPSTRNTDPVLLRADADGRVEE